VANDVFSSTRPMRRVALTLLPGSPVAGAAEVFWRFTAAPGTTITHINVDRFLGKQSDPWRPYGRADGAIFEGECQKRRCGELRDQQRLDHRPRRPLRRRKRLRSWSQPPRCLDVALLGRRDPDRPQHADDERPVRAAVVGRL